MSNQNYLIDLLDDTTSFVISDSQPRLEFQSEAVTSEGNAVRKFTKTIPSFSRLETISRESDDEMLDVSFDQNPFADPNHLNQTTPHRISRTNVQSSRPVSITKVSGPIHDLPPGVGQYADFETIDWVKEIAVDRNRHREIEKSRKLSWRGLLYSYWDSGSGWFCALLVGIIAGIVAGVLDIGTSWMTDLKEGVCLEAFWLNKEQCCWSANDTEFDQVCDYWYSWSRLLTGKDSGTNAGTFILSYLFFIFWALLMALLAAMLVKTIAPYACGSGIPEIKTILSGFIIRGYLGKWTLIIKSVGMLLAVAAGLSLGKEGPMVHVASCCGNIVSYIFPKYSRNEAKKREILSASAAAGVALAFGAPIGGVLFSLEEASYYFPLKTMFRSFFCAMISANVLRIINPFGNDRLVMFSVDYTAEWHIVELIPFAILGALGGVFGALFIRANIYMCRIRKTTRLGNWPVREVLLVTLITGIVSYPLSYLRMSSSELIRILVSRCGAGDDLEICAYERNLSDSSLVTFGSFPAGTKVYEALGKLAFALIFKMIITVFTFGIKIPAGLFIPSMCVGAIMGRIMGVGVEQIAVMNHDKYFFHQSCKSGQPCVNPGLYALVGAAACLGGVTRMTISLVVIMLELTGGLTYIIPLMVASMVSKWAGDRITHGGVYDEHIRLNNYPYLSGEEVFTHTTMAQDVMSPRPSDPPLQVITQESMTVEDLENLIVESEHSGFPVVLSPDSQYLVGYITRRDLTLALDHSRAHEDGVVSNSRVYFKESVPLQKISRPNSPVPINLYNHLDLAPITVTDETPMDTVMDIFRKLGLRQVLVTHNGRLLGIITKKDVLRHILQLNRQHPTSVAFS